jgi:hypothetical protein
MIEQNDFGIITERNDLNNLEILVLEIKAENPNYIIDEDIMPFLWEKWFGEMNVSRYKVYRSKEPSYMESKIKDFLKNPN